MLLSIKYDVVFVVSGKRLKQNIELNSGLTLITGANESGKSVMMEMILFGLFGTPALRGPVSEYESVSTEVKFHLNGQDYCVERTLSSAKMTPNQATGKKGVTQQICRLLGLPFKGFSVVCAVMQGEVEALGKMRPADRKRMIETALGFSGLDAVEKWAGGYQKSLRSELAGLEATIQHEELDSVADEPMVESAMAEAVTKVNELSIRVQNSKQAKSEIETQTRTILRYMDLPPLEPLPKNGLDRLSIRESLDKIEAAKKRLTQIEVELAMTPVSSFDEEDRPNLLQALEDWKLFDVYKDAPPKIEDAEKLRQEEKAHKLSQQIVPVTPCSNCGHEEMSQAHRDARDWLATYEGIVPKSLNSDHYHAQEGSTSDLFWKNNADLPPCPAKPNLASWEITKELKALDSVEYLSGLTLEVEALSVEVSKGRGLQELLNKGNEYDREIARREGLMMAAEDAKDKVRELSEQLVPDEVAAQLENYNQTWRNLDVRLKEIQACKAVIESNLRVRDLMFERQEKLANYGGIVEATKATRSIVKTMLAPTLSKSATHYMSILSGYHREVQVTGDMDVLVEGQGVHSLSGSAKACADLSLRFAIADTLMKNRFPVLLCDELDASFDEQRAARITEMLKSRAEKYQVLMISHKDIESDHIVSLV